MTYNVEFPKLGLQFNLNPTAFSIGSFSVQWYGILIAIGFILAVTYGMRMSKSLKINPDKFLDAIIVGLICGVIGARLYYVIFYPGDKYWSNPIEILNIKEGGLGIYGGIIGGFLGGGLVCKIRKINILSVFDATCVGFCIGQGIGRWGNFVNQEAFGRGTSLPWGMQSNVTAYYVNGPVHPCFLYESLWMLLGALLLYIFTKKFRRYDGQTFILYLGWYGLERFIIEGLRTDSLIIPHTGLRVSQVVSLVLFAFSVITLIVLRKRTALSGCGLKKIMELNGISFEEETVTETPAKSTIFADEEITENNKEDNKEDDSEMNDLDKILEAFPEEEE